MPCLATDSLGRNCIRKKEAKIRNETNVSRPIANEMQRKWFGGDDKEPKFGIDHFWEYALLGKHLPNKERADGSHLMLLDD